MWAPKYGFVQCRCFSFNRLGISALEVIASSIPPMIIICSHILLADKPTGSEYLPLFQVISKWARPQYNGNWI